MLVMKKTQTTVPVSVVIVTRNRARTVLDCLKSLLQQTVQPAELVVVDNASVDDTQQMIAAFRKKSHWSVKSVIESRLGYPIVYNRGLKEVVSDWVVFIDDDCVALPEWLESYWNAIQKIPPQQLQKTAALVGKSLTQSPITIWSLAVLAVDQYWKNSAITQDNQILDFETLDNKNIAYYKPFLIKHGCSFNEAALREPGNGAAEDADLGMQLQQYGRAFFVPKAVVFHKDPNTFMWYYRRLLSGAVANFHYQRRWSSFRNRTGLTHLPKPHFRDYWPQFCLEQSLTGIKKFLVYTIVWSGFVVTKICQWWWKVKYS